MEHEGSLSCSQKPATGLYPEPAESNISIRSSYCWHGAFQGSKELILRIKTLDLASVLFCVPPLPMDLQYSFPQCLTHVYLHMCC